MGQVKGPEVVGALEVVIGFVTVGVVTNDEMVESAVGGNPLKSFRLNLISKFGWTDSLW